MRKPKTKDQSGPAARQPSTGAARSGLDTGPLTRAPRSTGNFSARPVESPTGSVIVEHLFKGTDFLVRDILGVAGDAAARPRLPARQGSDTHAAARQTPDPRS